MRLIRFLPFLLACAAIAAPSSVPIERVMRSIQARAPYIYGRVIDWPTRLDGMPAPKYPPDGFYAEEMKIPNWAMQLVSAIADSDGKVTGAWNTLVPQSELVEVLVQDVIPNVDPGSVTTGNYPEKLALIARRQNLAKSVSIASGHAIVALRYPESGSLSDWTNWSPVQETENFTVAGAARGLAAARFMGSERPTSYGDPDCPGNFIGYGTADGVLEDARLVQGEHDEWYEYRYQSYAYAYAWYGNVSLAFGPNPGRASVYLRLASGQGTPTNTPIPVVDDQYHLWKTVTGSGIWTSERIPSTSLIWPTLDIPYGNYVASNDWALVGQMAVIEPFLDLSPSPVPCACECPIGTTNLSLGSISISIAMSSGTLGRESGYLTVHEREPSPRLNGPAVLDANVGANTSFVVLRDSVGVRQVYGKPTDQSQVLADAVVVDPTTWEVRIYKGPENIGPKVGQYFDQTGKTPHQTIRFENTWSGETFKKLVVSESGELGTKTREYRWSSSGNKKSWELLTIDPTFGVIQHDELSSTLDEADGSLVKEQRSLSATDKPLSHTVSTERQFPWGNETVSVVKKGIDQHGTYTGIDRTTDYRYYTDDSMPGSFTGLVAEQWCQNDSAWIRYEYTTEGQIRKVRSQYLDAPRSAEDDESRVTMYEYSSLDLNGDGVKDDVTIETRQLLGQLVGRSIDIKWGDQRTTSTYAFIEVWHIVVVDPLVTSAEAAIMAPGSLVTKRRLNTAGPYRQAVISEETPAHQLSIRVENSSLSGTHWNGAASTDGSAVTEGTKTEEEMNADGGLVSSVTTDLATGVVVDFKIATSWDHLGRPLSFAYPNGQSSSQSFDCCGLTSETDQEGVITTYVRDSLGRVRERTKAGVTYRFTMDTLGRVVATDRYGSSGIILVSQAEYDGFGGVVLWRDGLGRETTNVVSVDSSGRTIKTKSTSSGSVVETYAEDGTLVSVVGDAAERQLAYEYGVDGDGEYSKELRIGSAGELTEWIKTYSDLAGRAYRTVLPDGAMAESFYDGLGQLVRTVDPDGVQTLFDYNSLGELFVTAVDLDRDGVIDFDGTDRITRTTRSYVTARSTTVERTVTETWSTINSATPTTVASVDRSVDGLSSWTTVSGLTTSTATVIDAVAGTRTESTTAPDATTAVRTFSAGRLASEARRAADATALETVRYGYDAHARLVETRRYADNATAAVDSVTAALPSVFALPASNAAVLSTTVTYFDDDQVHTVTTPDPDPTRTGPGFDAQTTTFTYDDAGRLWKTLLPDLTETVREYFPTGRLNKTSGSRTYPQEYTYDSQGRLKTLKTWQNFASATGAAVTTWNYDPVRGWLIGKTYADNTGPTYTYWPSGRLHARTWARTVAGQPLVTTYAFNNAGDLSTIDYSDTTPDVGFGYDRLGRRTSTTDAAGSLVTTYEGLTVATDDETYSADSPILPGLAVTRTRDSLQRPSSLSVPASVSVPSVTYSYQPRTGRLDTVSAGDLTHTYDYQPQSSLVATLTQQKTGATVLATTKTYDYLNRFVSSSSVSAVPSAVNSSAYAYNSANQRTRLTREDGAYWSFGYDALGQVTAATKHLADATTVLGLDQAFTFDDIGNRLTTTSSVASLVSTSVYSPNLLNQYDNRTVPPVVDVIGSAHLDATVTVNFQPTQRQGERWFGQLPVSNATSPVYAAARVIGVRSNQGPQGEDAVAEETRHALVAQTPEHFEYDLDGNLTADGRWTYIWDAENRLVSMETQASAVTAGVPKQRLEFAYDAAGRRIQKKVSEWNGSAYIVVNDTRFLYDGWNLLAELNGLASNAVVRSYVWGLDLSGSAQGAGGVGGLLAVNSGGATFLPAYDGNGNILAAYDSVTGAQVARFEYGPFGEVLESTGPAAAIPFGFSTKYTDVETSLIYYGFRFYNCSTGRWLSKDPIAENGGSNLYGYCDNDAVAHLDRLGLWPCTSAESGVASAWIEWFDASANYNRVDNSAMLALDIYISDKFLAKGGKISQDELYKSRFEYESATASARVAAEGKHSAWENVLIAQGKLDQCKKCVKEGWYCRWGHAAIGATSGVVSLGTAHVTGGASVAVSWWVSQSNNLIYIQYCERLPAGTAAMQTVPLVLNVAGAHGASEAVELGMVIWEGNHAAGEFVGEDKPADEH